MAAAFLPFAILRALEGYRGVLLDSRVLLVAARRQRIEYRALLAMAVGEFDGGRNTVIELREHSMNGDAARGPERAFVFAGLRHLRLIGNIAKRSPQGGPRNSSGPFSISVVCATGFRSRVRDVDVQREVGASFS
ncbi:hypothetical protein ACFY0R_17335 [Streptomyces sp. NPDC001633]|uniref:hypothetical protein n=1 Tax=Streptomyces sp. NPDC001633 TaxID=3364595 RepID=UPI00369B8020